jgi:hypothetical protein
VSGEKGRGQRRRTRRRTRRAREKSRSSSFLRERKAVEGKKRRSVTTPPEGAAASGARRADRRARIARAIGGIMFSTRRCGYPSEAGTYRASSSSWSSGRRERPCAMTERTDENTGSRLVTRGTRAMEGHERARRAR